MWRLKSLVFTRIRATSKNLPRNIQRTPLNWRKHNLRLICNWKFPPDSVNLKMKQMPEILKQHWLNEGSLNEWSRAHWNFFLRFFPQVPIFVRECFVTKLYFVWLAVITFKLKWFLLFPSSRQRAAQWLRAIRHRDPFIQRHFKVKIAGDE